jgi:hypothetical protein
MCYHTSRISDDRTGDVICLDCCQVVGFVYVDNQTTDSVKYDFSWATWAEKMQARETILEILAHLHLDEFTTLAENILELFLKLCDPAKRLPCVRYCGSSIDLVNQKTRARLAFAILETLNRAGVPRPMRKIADLCSVSPKDLLQIENTCGTTASYAAPHTYMNIVCSVLSLPMPHQFNKLATLLCERVELGHYGMRPEILVAACIWSLLSKLKGSGTDEVYNFIQPSSYVQTKMETICDTFGITERSLKKWLAIIPPYELVFNKNGQLQWDDLKFLPFA